ncbi:MAG: ATP-binding protein [Acidobacteriia bacterium]|nr:ATP-binding protein [Terriglobia bacterium]
MRRRLSRAVWIVLICPWAGGEELPVRIYTMADGLARDNVLSIRRDSHGYLWFGTAEGLSIFDGYQFTNYTVADGLPQRAVHDVLETRQGEYWIATYGGLCRFDPKPASGKHCVPYRFSGGVLASQINRLVERRDGSIWAGTEGGLWRLTKNGAALLAERVHLPSLEEDALRVFSLLDDRDGRLWAASSDGLFVIQDGGRITRIGYPEGLSETFVLDVMEDVQGRIWAATNRGICRIEANGDRFAVPGVYLNRSVENQRVLTLFQTADGKLWAGGWGLFQFRPDESASGRVFHRVATPSPETFIYPIAEDADGNLWAAGAGAMKITRHNFTRFSKADGLRSLRMHALTKNRDGRVCAISLSEGRQTLHVFDGGKFLAVDPYLPPGIGYAWGESQITFQDHAGEWWVPTNNGLLRFAAPAHLIDLARTPPKNIYTKADGLSNDVVLLLFEDSRADLWIGTRRGLSRWDRKTGQIQRYGVADGLPLATERPATLGTPQFFAEDRQGDLWVGFHPYGLARYRGGRFEFYSEAEGLPKGEIGWVYSDHLGRLWIASNEGGAARIDDVSRARPSFRTYTTAQGLSSNQVHAVVEDRDGRIYLCGGGGVDRLDPDSGSVRHFTAADGLPPSMVAYALRDRDGALWFASSLGLSRYVPEPDRVAAPQTPLIRRLRVAGSPVSVSELGELEISGLRFGAAQNNLRIEFGSLNFRSGEVLRYQYRLRGTDADWGPPEDERTVTYSGLPPGTYEFAVRAINGDGLASARAATIGFVIVPPLWRRTWAIAIEIGLLVLAIYLAHWYRLRQLLHVERIRMRLASDLHDDIGSGLSEIALLSEVAVAEPRSAGEIATRLGDRARQLREGMSEIVWSVDPRQRSLADLTGRVRQSVYSMLESNGRSVEFEGPDADTTAAVPVPPDRARQVLLICREALTNIARHACASEVTVRMELKSDALLVDVRDNGRGFDPEITYHGMGLRNLRRRAEEAGGELVIDSSPGKGARVRVRLPLR